MTRNLDHDLLSRLTAERHRMVKTGSFGASYSATLDAYRMAEGLPIDSKRRQDNEIEDCLIDPKTDYKELE